MSKKEKYVVPKKANQLLPHDAKALQKVSSYAAEKKVEVEKLAGDVKCMNDLSLWWDSKVPEKDKRFYNWFSGLTTSNREYVLQEIKKYQEFYKQLSETVQKISNEGTQSDSEKINPHIIILDLNEKLSQLAEAAKQGEDTTGSSVVYDLHQSFIKKHEMLENMIMRVECVALKKELKKATDGWQKSIQSINNMENKLKATEEKYDQMCTGFNRLMLQNEQLLEQQKVLLENNKKMEQQQEILLQENAAIKTLLRKMAKYEKNEKQ